jgi:hypothetical protein
VSYLPPGRVFSRNAHLQVPRLRALREHLANLSGVSGSSLGAGKQPEPSAIRHNPDALARQLFFRL